jgi:hypothetical protein
VRGLLIVAALLELSGCAAEKPEVVFRKSTRAFAEGDVALAASYFSERLRAARPVKSLEDYYWTPERRKAIAYLIKDQRFRLVHQEADIAEAEVTWTTGRVEPVHFVREGGKWKLDLPPSGEGAAGAEAPVEGPTPKSP